MHLSYPQQVRCHGYSLIETLLYVALFAFIMPVLVATAMHLIETANRVQERAYTEMEAQFIFAKLGLLFETASHVVVNENGLSIETVSSSGEHVPVVIVHDPIQGSLAIQRGHLTPQLLALSPVSAVSFESRVEPGVGGMTTVTVTMELVYNNSALVYQKSYPFRPYNL